MRRTDRVKTGFNMYATNTAGVRAQLPFTGPARNTNGCNELIPRQNPTVPKSMAAIPRSCNKRVLKINVEQQEKQQQEKQQQHKMSMNNTKRGKFRLTD
jgi:hypothetical protein